MWSLVLQKSISWIWFDEQNVIKLSQKHKDIIIPIEKWINMNLIYYIGNYCQIALKKYKVSMIPINGDGYWQNWSYKVLHLKSIFYSCILCLLEAVSLMIQNLGVL